MREKSVQKLEQYFENISRIFENISELNKEEVNYEKVLKNTYLNYSNIIDCVDTCMKMVKDLDNIRLLQNILLRMEKKTKSLWGILYYNLINEYFIAKCENDNVITKLTNKIKNKLFEEDLPSYDMVSKAFLEDICDAKTSFSDVIQFIDYMTNYK